MNIDRLDLNLLRVFRAVYEARGVSRAAARLGLSQPAISNALARLRVSLGDELFLRTPQGLMPSSLAEQIGPDVIDLLGRLEQAVVPDSGFDPAAETSPVTLGLSDYGALVLLPALRRELAALAPARAIFAGSIDRLGYDSALDSSRISLAIATLPEPPARFTRIMLLSDGFLTLMRPDHPLAKGTMTAEKFRKAEHLLVSAAGQARGAVDAALGDDTPRRVALTVPHAGDAGALLAESDLICTLPARLALAIAGPYGLATRRPPVTPNPYRLAMIWHRRDDAAPAHRWLRQLVAKAARELPVASA